MPEQPDHHVICPSCGESIPPWPADASSLACAACAAAFTIREGAPLFLEKARGMRFGLAEATFVEPERYGLVVALKRMAFKDAVIGTEDYIRDREVLDVGCGPSLNFAHLENHHALARRYVGVDTSAEFVVAARRENSAPKYFFAQSAASRIPVADKSVDTTIVSFTLHHIESDFEKVMPELVRVTRGHIIILDHLRSRLPGVRQVQDAYWRLFDGGCAYQTDLEWADFLKGTTIVKRVRTGAIFGHVVKYICAVESARASADLTPASA